MNSSFSKYKNEVFGIYEKAVEKTSDSIEETEKIVQEVINQAQESIKTLQNFLEDQLNRAKEQWESLFPKNKEQGWYDDGHQCWAPWVKLPFRTDKYHIVDPLVLDLDGDGIETVAANGFAGSLFDHDNDGIRTAGGWLASDDGFLVWDKNGNGRIDNGTELFGDNTALSGGKKAAHGFAALAQHDGNKDGVIDAKDKIFSQLRVWRDLNQDGISQSGELFTAASLKIKSFNLAYQNTRTVLGNGNTLAQNGSYTKTDGKTAQMGDILLQADTLYSRYANPVKLTDKQAQAANLHGIGRLRDLREAAALSGALGKVLSAYSAAQTKQEQMKQLDGLIRKWAKTDPGYCQNSQRFSLIN
ncbi:Uncharacterised protein [Kingella potus]|uniref:Uncharacterized protein n=2 Tax=Kingella potus TaxID=265175 RepID=A0A377R5I7_9NEIS|nr:Uncharacterised protein [Kingella potus]